MNNKRQIVLDVLHRKKTGYIPVIPTALGFAIEHAPFSAEEMMGDPAKFAAANISMRQEFGLDGLFTGVFHGVTLAMGGGLVDKHGHASQSGNGTIQNPADMKKLQAFDIDNCPQLDFMVQVIQEMKKRDAEEPIFTIVDNPCMVAAALMDGENYYYHMLKNPAFVHELTEHVFEPLVQCVKVLLNAGTDILWLPLPTIGGTCISRGQYEAFCIAYNRRFNQLALEQGACIVVHTCGKWNDRFDLAANEGAHALHVAEADLAALKHDHGDKVALMGQLPTVGVVLMGDEQTVYEEALRECLTAAPGGGFILSPDCGMPGKTPKANVRAMVQAARQAEKQLAGNC